MLKKNQKPGGQPVPPLTATPTGALPQTPAPAVAPQSRVGLYVCLGLAALVVAIYVRTSEHQFVNIDDGQYIYENPHLKGGLTWPGVVWAFTTTYAYNWHPLTWLTHLLDWELYGAKAGGHHLSSVLVHAANAGLLFLALRSLTGRLWESAAAAALWAAHPLRVESVAWVSERKDVLCGLFFVLALWAYAGYARAPSLRRYLLVAVLFALGLMAKPMLVTLPAVLLLLDYWPLGRLGTRAGLRRCVLEKLPLLALSIASSVVTVHAQGIAVGTLEKFPLWVRVANAADAYLVYVVQTAAPVELAVFYPHPGAGLPAWRAAVGCVLIVGVSVVAVLLRRSRPYLLVGWLWYVGMLVPVIGLVQVGAQAHADRYTYLPQIGLWVALAWAASDLPRRTQIVGAVIAVFAALSYHQVGYWRDDISLFSHALDCTTNNRLAHIGYAEALMKQGKMDEAAHHFQRAIEIDDDITAHLNMGYVYTQRGQLDEAAQHFRRALELSPGHEIAKPNMALVHLLRGYRLQDANQRAEAVAQFEAVLETDPGGPHDADARRPLGVLYVQLSLDAERRGQPAEALRLARKAAAHDPANPEARKRIAELERALAP